MSDVRHAFRRLAATPGFLAGSVLALTVTLGATIAVFVILERVVLAPLPYPQADRLVSIDHAAPGFGVPGGYGTSIGVYRAYADLAPIDAIALFQPGLSVLLTGAGEPVQATSMRVTSSFAGVFGVSLENGRWIEAADSETDATKVVVMSDRMAGRLFGGSAPALGRSVDLDSVPYQVVGVMSRTTLLPDDTTDLVVPYPHYPAERLGPFGSRLVARTKTGVGPSLLQPQLETALATLPTRLPGDRTATRVVSQGHVTSIVRPLKDDVVGAAGASLWTLTAACVLALVVAVVNLLNLFLVRADARRVEWSIRSAMGATRWRTTVSFVVEGLIVSSFGGLLGLLAGSYATHTLVAHLPFVLPRSGEVRLDGATVSASMAVAVAIGFILGGVPAARRRPSPADALRQVDRGETPGTLSSGRRAVVAAQVALSVIVLTGAVLLSRTALHLAAVSPGFESEDRIALGVTIARNDPAGARRDTAAIYESLLDRIRALPGVDAASMTTVLPLQGAGPRTPLEVFGGSNLPDDLRASVGVRGVGPDYARTLGIPIVAGRDLSEVDMTRDDVVVINRSLSRFYFPSGAALGGRVRPAGSSDPWMSVVGVIGDTPTVRLDESPAPQMLMPLRHAFAYWSAPSMKYVVQSRSAPASFTTAVRDVRNDLDPGAALDDPQPLRSVIKAANARAQAVAALVGFSAAATVLIALLGVYSLIAYTVALRRRELAVRMALGADRRQVSAMIVRQCTGAIVIGALVGLVAAAGASRLLVSQLFAVRWYDPMTYGAVFTGLISISLLASWLPAFRASSGASLRAQL